MILLLALASYFVPVNELVIPESYATYVIVVPAANPPTTTGHNRHHHNHHHHHNHITTTATIIAMSANEAPDAPRPRKSFIPLEYIPSPLPSFRCTTTNKGRCNPELMTDLVHRLGLSPKLAFVDIYSMDPDLLAFAPRPALALLLVFPVSPAYDAHRTAEDNALFPEPGTEGEGESQGRAGEGPLWFKQTIRNACGMMGILHAVANGPKRDLIGLFPPTPNCIGTDACEVVELGTPLYKFLDKARSLASADERARALEENEELEAAHRSAASRGDTATPDANDDVDLHYVCLVKFNGHLYELDGRRRGPLDRGLLGDNEDVLGKRATEVVQSFIDREKDSGRLDFSLVALTRSYD